MLDSLDTVFYTAIFLFPGFLINAVVNAINPAKKTSDSDNILKYLGYSIINCASCCWLYSLLLNVKNTNPHVFWILLFISSIIGSIIIGFIIAVIKQKEWIEKLLVLLNLRSIHPIQTAWDYVFSKQEASFVIITLNDNSKIKGWYSSNSFTSSDNEDRDIFIEKIYKDGDGDSWIESPDNVGMYIPKDQIKYIEFKKGSETNE